VNLYLSVVADESKFAEFVHEVAHAGSVVPIISAMFPDSYHGATGCHSVVRAYGCAAIIQSKLRIDEVMVKNDQSVTFESA
jgi:hypothetical protein